MRILGIETSCDETAAAVIEVTEQRNNRATKQPVVQLLGCSVLSNIVASQVKIHAKTGGVVPEVAARAHVEKIIPVIERALKASKSSVTKYSAAAHHSVMRSGKGIDVIAVTAGPGLVTSLLVGVEVARTLAWLCKKPLIAVNHLAGHVYANWLPSQTKQRNNRATKQQIVPAFSCSVIQFPILALIVSGGHTELVLMRKHLDFQVIGSTRDDAAGEAFDKVAKMLGLGYPGGPAIAAEAEKFETIYGGPASGCPEAGPPVIQFPRPMLDSPDFDFSFSGLKTAVLYYIKEHGAKNKEQICHEFQEAVVDVLVSKTVRAAKKYRVKTVLLGGGVAANVRLRQRLVESIKRHIPSSVLRLPSLQYTTDNAAMIAAAGYFMARAKQFTPWQKLDVDPNWQLGKKFNPLPR